VLPGTCGAPTTAGLLPVAMSMAAPRRVMALLVELVESTNAPDWIANLALLLFAVPSALTSPPGRWSPSRCRLQRWQPPSSRCGPSRLT